MKAPFSKIAKKIFNNKIIINKINKLKIQGKSLNNLKIVIDNKEMILKSSERNFL